MANGNEVNLRSLGLSKPASVWRGYKIMIDLQSIKTRLEPIFIKHGIVRAIVFGSYAKGTATEKSDIDLVIDSNGYLDVINFFTAQYELSKMLTVKSDIYELMEIKEGSALQNEIQKHGVVIYER